MKSNHKLKSEKSKHIQAIKQPVISIDLNFFFINQIKLKYLKSILQSRSSLLPPYCRGCDTEIGNVFTHKNAISKRLKIAISEWRQMKVLLKGFQMTYDIHKFFFY